MKSATLTDARIRTLEPRKAAHDIRDAKLQGFGLRVMPSGRKRFFVHFQHGGRRVWRAAAVLAAIRRDGSVPASPDDTVFEAVAEAAFRRNQRIWKPQTMEVNRGYLRGQIMPGFAGRQIAEITRRDVVRWFASLAATPTAADRSVPVLSVIMREAERLGFREEGSNPCPGIRRYRRKGRERFLSDTDIRSLGFCLDARGNEHHPAVAVVRLLLLTGCRKSEILTLRWTGWREGALLLRDSKTGPGPSGCRARHARRDRPDLGMGLPGRAGRGEALHHLAGLPLEGRARRGRPRGRAPSRPEAITLPLTPS